MSPNVKIERKYLPVVSHLDLILAYHPIHCPFTAFLNVLSLFFTEWQGIWGETKEPKLCGPVQNVHLSFPRSHNSFVFARNVASDRVFVYVCVYIWTRAGFNSFNSLLASSCSVHGVKSRKATSLECREHCIDERLIWVRWSMWRLS